MGCLHQVDIKRCSLTWYTARIIAPLSWRWGRIKVPSLLGHYVWVSFVELSNALNFLHPHFLIKYHLARSEAKKLYCKFKKIRKKCWKDQQPWTLLNIAETSHYCPWDAGKKWVKWFYFLIHMVKKMFWNKIHVKATYSNVTNKTNHKTSYLFGRRSYIFLKKALM